MNIKCKKHQVLKDKIYSDLPTWEIFLWVCCWIFGVFYSIYQVFYMRGSLENLLPEKFKSGIFDGSKISIYLGSKKDISDDDWDLMSRTIINLSPWLIVHLIGTQILQRIQRRNILPIFHAFLPIMYLSQFLSYRQLILLVTQPLLFFVVSEIIQQFAAVWIVAVVQKFVIIVVILCICAFL